MKLRRLLSAILTAVLLAVLFAGGAFADEAGELAGHIVILHTNDSHGRADDNLGFTRVAYAKETLENAGATVLLLDAGDTLHGLPIATVSEGEAIVKLMNQVGYDAMTPGNHDFNYGKDRLSELAALAEFPVLSANVTKAEGGEYLPGTVVIEKGLAKFGVFGLTTPETVYKTAAENTEGLVFGDPIEAARQQVEYLESQGCSLIIALAHLGLEDGAEVTSWMVAEQVEGIDIIVDGHSHSVLENGLWAGDTLIVSAGEYIEYVGCVDIAPDGTASAGLLNDEDLGEADVNAKVDALLTEIKAGQETLLREVVGTVGADLEGTRDLVRTQETNLGNLAADAARSVTGADVAVLNGGGIRDSIPAGEVTRGQLIAVFPFGNFVVTQEVTGAKLRAVLENGVSLYPDADGRFPQVSGLTFKFDPAQPAGKRVFDVTVGGEALDEKKTYVLATNDFIAGGNDEFPLGDIAVTGEYDSLEEVLIGYIAGLDAQSIPDAEGRIVRETKPAE